MTRRDARNAKLIRQYTGAVLAMYLDADELTRAAGREWYALEAERCMHYGLQHGLPQHAVAGAAAAISPGMRWSLVFSYLEALRKDPEAKVPTYSREFVRRAVRCLKGEAPLAVLSGPKVCAFYGLLSGTDPDAVVIDGHAWHICLGIKAGVREGSGVSPARYALAVRAYREAAEVLGEAAHAVQAACWIHWRRAHGVESVSEREPGVD